MRIAHLNMQAVRPALVSSAVACVNADSRYTYAPSTLNPADTVP